MNIENKEYREVRIFSILNTTTIVKSLVVLQKKVVRSISHNDSNVPYKNIFYSLNILNFCDIKYENYTLCYKALNLISYFVL